MKIQKPTSIIRVGNETPFEDDLYGSSPTLGGFASLEDPWDELAEVVPPVDPRVAAATDVNLVFDAVLVQHFRQALRARQCEVFVTDADREQFHRMIDRVGTGQEVGIMFLPLRGVTAEETGTATPTKANWSG